MKTLTIALAASLLAVALPFAAAEEPCQKADETTVPEAIKHPQKANAYLYLSPTQPDKIGEWTETNTKKGLQTVDCLTQDGTGLVYAADTKASILG